MPAGFGVSDEDSTKQGLGAMVAVGQVAGGRS